MTDSPDCPGCGARLELEGAWWVCPNEDCDLSGADLEENLS